MLFESICTAAVETEPTEADVPEKDYAGKEFRIFTRGETTGKFWHKDLAAEELNGDPLNDSDPEMIGIVMETFSAESRKTVLPAYYDVALTRKSTRDEESRQMIDIIIEGKRFDVGMLYDIGGIASSIQKLVMSKSMDIASMWASIEKSMATALEDLYKDE